MSAIDNGLTLRRTFDQELAHLHQDITPAKVEEFRVRWLGKKSQLTALMADLKDVPKDERPQLGKIINDLREHFTLTVTDLQQKAIHATIAKKIAQEPLDITLPVQGPLQQGALHPVTLIQNRLLSVFRKLGFSVYDGPEIDTDFYNFSALNIPMDHPARDMQDTFFVAGYPNLVLRTHTSNVQIHAMLQEKPPLRLVVPGKVFRVDSDATHTPMFHQLECVVVDRGIRFSHLKGIIDYFMKAIFGEDLKTRLRPSFFPFVEPGAEVDVSCTICRGKAIGCGVCKETGWLEVGGCGMIHPNVFEAVSYDSEEYTGFAFGFGIDRMAMLAYGLPDLRQFFAGDYRFQKQFPIDVS